MLLSGAEAPLLRTEHAAARIAWSEPMSDNAEDPRELARRKLIGRAVVIGFLALLAIYVAVTFWPH
jgi:hypothetical protein